MRRDEQLDEMERTISRIRMDNDAMREEIANWKAERDRLLEVFQQARTYTGLEAHPCPLCTWMDGKMMDRCAMHRKTHSLELENDAYRKDAEKLSKGLYERIEARSKFINMSAVETALEHIDNMKRLNGELEKKLEQYGMHHDWCQCSRSGGNGHCDCGLM